MPLLQAATRDKDSFRLRCEALYILAVMLSRCPSLVPESSELQLLLNSIYECSEDYLNWLVANPSKVNHAKHWFDDVEN